MKQPTRRPARGAPASRRPATIATDADTTRERILAAARPLFAEHGFAGTSIRDITTAAGVNLAAVTYHFTTKQLLYVAVLEQIVGPIGARIEQATQGDAPALDRIERVVRAFFDHIRHNPDMPSFMVREMASGRALSGPIVDTLSRALPAVATVIAHGQQRGEIRAGDPLLLTLSTIAQPVYLYLARPAIAQVAGIDPNDPAVADRILAHVVTTVRAALEQR
jgi:AcrR family transcriptional regulator